MLPLYTTKFDVFRQGKGSNSDPYVISDDDAELQVGSNIAGTIARPKTVDYGRSGVGRTGGVEQVLTGVLETELFDYQIGDRVHDQIADEDYQILWIESSLGLGIEYNYCGVIKALA